MLMNGKWVADCQPVQAKDEKGGFVRQISPGAIGTAVGQQHLRSILSFCNSLQMNAIEAYIQFKPDLITGDGEVTNDSTRELLQNYINEFRNFIERV